MCDTPQRHAEEAVADRLLVEKERTQPELHLRGFTYLHRNDLLPELGVAIDHAGGWVLERRSLTAASLELSLEVQAASLPEVYAAMLASGVEMTRDSHRALAQQCLCSLHLPLRRGVESILLLRLEMHFLEGPREPLELAQSLPPRGALA